MDCWVVASALPLQGGAQAAAAETTTDADITTAVNFLTQQEFCRARTSEASHAFGMMKIMEGEAFFIGGSMELARPHKTRDGFYDIIGLVHGSDFKDQYVVHVVTNGDETGMSNSMKLFEFAAKVRAREIGDVVDFFENLPRSKDLDPTAEPKLPTGLVAG